MDKQVSWPNQAKVKSNGEGSLGAVLNVHHTSPQSAVGFNVNLYKFSCILLCEAQGTLLVQQPCINPLAASRRSDSHLIYEGDEHHGLPLLLLAIEVCFEVLRVVLNDGGALGCHQVLKTEKTRQRSVWERELLGNISKN